MKKQEIKRAVDLIAHYYSSANWYQRTNEVKDHRTKASHQRDCAAAIRWLMDDSKIKVSVYRDQWGNEYAVAAWIKEDTVYIRWISTACHPWDEISFDLFKDVVNLAKSNGFKMFTTDGTAEGMNEI